MGQIEECEACQAGTEFPEGMYCFTLHRYISKSESYPNPCGEFTIKRGQPERNEDIK